jgi:tetratricopeptide (TPR) repeat protein
VQENPQDLDALERLAHRLAGAGRHEAVIPVYRAIIATTGADSPRGRTARFNLGVALMRLERLVEAEDEFLRLLAGGEHSPARFNLGAICRSQGRLTDAKAHLESVIARRDELNDDEVGAAYGLLGNVLGDMRDHSAALAAHARAVKLRPRATDAWLDYAAAARAAGRYGTALMALSQARGLSPQQADIRARIGIVLLAMHEATGEPDLLAEAMRALRRSLDLDPDQPDIRALLDAHAGGE